MAKMQNGWPSRKNNYSRLMTSREADKRDAKVEIEAETGTDEAHRPAEIDPHVYDGERCLHCNVNVYDNMIYGPFECTRTTSISYTTETEDPK